MRQVCGARRSEKPVLNIQCKSNSPGTVAAREWRSPAALHGGVGLAVGKLG